MDRREHLLTCLAEECTEVGQRVAKALRFGLAEVQRDQPLTNAERIVDELHDLFAVAAILRREGVIPDFVPTETRVQAKLAKIERYMEIARAHGALEQGGSKYDPDFFEEIPE